MDNQNGSSSGHGHGHHHRYKYCKSTDTITFHADCICKEGACVGDPVPMPCDGEFRKFGWSFKGPYCGDVPINLHLYVGDEDRGPIATIDQATPHHGCAEICEKYQCGDVVRIKAKYATTGRECALCCVSISLTSVRKCKVPKHKHKHCCPELAEFMGTEGGDAEVPVGEANKILVDLNNPRPLPPTPSISHLGGGVFELEPGLYSVNYQVGCVSKQSTDITLFSYIWYSTDGGATWQRYTGSVASTRFLAGNSGGWLTVGSATPTMYVPEGDKWQIAVAVFRTDDSTVVNIVDEESAIRITKHCFCRPHDYDHDDDDDDDDNDA